MGTRPQRQESRDIDTRPKGQGWSMVHSQFRDRDEGQPSVESHGGVQLLIPVPRHFRSTEPIRIAAADNSVDSTTSVDVALEPKNSVLRVEF